MSVPPSQPPTSPHGGPPVDPSSTVVTSVYQAPAEQRPAPRGQFRLTVRARIALLYGGLFLAAGLVLIVVDYFFVRWRLNHSRQGLPAYCRAPGSRTRDVALSCDAASRRVTLDQILEASGFTLVVVGLLAVLVGYLMAGRFMAPVKRITATARRVASRPDRALHARIDLEGPDDELKELADTVDGMLDRLDTAFDAQRRFVGNASHELRTPLAINRTLLEVAMSDPNASPELVQLATALLATNERSERMIEGLLLLAKADIEIPVKESVALGDLAARAVTLCRPEAEQRGVLLRTAFTPVSVWGDGILLERVALNLVQNALRYNVPGGWVDVVSYDQGSHGLLVVANSGPEVPEYVVGSLFEPFRRFRREGEARDPKDRGVGLGLSIVRAVVRGHGGRIGVQARPGGGLIVRVWLSCRPDAFHVG
jgi:signal transduction histidine kinase